MEPHQATGEGETASAPQQARPTQRPAHGARAHAQPQSPTLARTASLRALPARAPAGRPLARLIEGREKLTHATPVSPPTFQNRATPSKLRSGLENFLQKSKRAWNELAKSRRRKSLSRMKKPTLAVRRAFTAAILYLATASIVLATENSFRGNVLEVALFMRANLDVPVVVDPSLLNERMLGKSFRIDTSSGEKALTTLRSAIQADNLTVTKIGPTQWISSGEAKAEDFRVVDLILGARNYGILARQLPAQLQAHEKKNELLAAINVIAEQERQYSQNQRDIKLFMDRMRGIDFNLRLAVSGTALSAPDPGKAKTVTMQKEALQREIIQKGGSVLAALNKAMNSHPPEFISVYDVLPEVAFQQLDSDYLATAFANYKLYMDASATFGFDTTSEELNWATGFQEGLRKRQAAIKTFAENYQKLLSQAGLAVTSNTSGITSSAALDAALQLFDVHGDRRQAVRRVIGEKIMNQLEEQVRRLQSSGSSFHELKPRSNALYLFGNEAKSQLAPLSEKNLSEADYSYDLAEEGRLGAVTALIAGSTDGATRTLSVELQPKSDAIKQEQPTIENIFGSSEKQVSLHAADDRAFMDVNFKASIKDSLDLIASRYSRDLFDSSVSIAFDSTTDINVGGDSAGVALGLATLSHTREIPLDRKLAVTGSVRRYGDVRPVGGVYQKGKAAFDELCVALVLPAQNLENLFYLQPRDILSRHVFAVSNFSQAAGVAQVGEDKENATAANAIQLYNYALLSAIGGNLDDAAAFSEASNKLAPFHFSSRLMAMLLRVAQIKPSTCAQVGTLVRAVSTAKPESRLALANQSKGSGVNDGIAAGSTASSVLDHILTDFVAEGITGSEAINSLAQKLREITGKSVNIIVRNRDKTALATTDMHISTSDASAAEILQMICTVADAEYSQDGDIIIVGPRGASEPHNQPRNRPTSSSRGFKLLAATYGAESEQQDVTAIVANKISQGRLSLSASNNELGGDPAPGKTKQLQLKLLIDGREVERSFREGETVSLP